MRIAGPHAVFDPRFQKLGIHPGGGATWMLQRGVGPQARGPHCCSGCASTPTRRSPRPRTRSADDPVAAARALAAGPAAAPREVVVATKAAMRATANPGTVDLEQHRLAVDVEIGPQAASIESPEFAADWLPPSEVSYGANATMRSARRSTGMSTI